MMRTRIAALVVLGFLLAGAPQAHAQIGPSEVDAGLRSEEGLLAEVHGADPQTGYYVLAFRNPENFFDFLHVSMLADWDAPNRDEIRRIMADLTRHDLVRVKGRLDSSLNTPQPHALLTLLEVVSRFEPPYPEIAAYERHTSIPAELEGKTEAVFKVHTVLAKGEILVVDYGDSIVPVYVDRPAPARSAQRLYRNDKIRLKFFIAAEPGRPPHLRVTDAPDAITVVDAVLRYHGEKVDVCGTLAMFPKSPQVLFDVFAIEVETSGGLNRTFTLVNFSDTERFREFRQMAQDIWDRHTGGVVARRNFFVNPQIKACAIGTGNVQDPNQANPQIVIEDVRDLMLELRSTEP